MEGDTHLGVPNDLSSFVVSSIVLIFSDMDECVLFPDQRFPVPGKFHFQLRIFLNTPIVLLTDYLD